MTGSMERLERGEMVAKVIGYQDPKSDLAGSSALPDDNSPTPDRASPFLYRLRRLLSFVCF